MSTELPVLKPAEYASDQDVRWCPGCGDYAILAQMKKVLASMRVDPDKTVFVSGIGCSSRFPYYMETYGIHSIHGRAPAVATGVKVARPDLAVWVITGDGDALSIGGNHLMHAIRRNLDINIVLFNNRIYGLTKGQYSPTSPLGKVTKSTPLGSVDNPLHPLSIAIGCEATFVARSIDVNIKHLGETLQRAAEHSGVSFVEVYQNCNVFNDGAFSYATDRASKADSTLELHHGKPLIFGKNRDKGIRINGMEPEVVELGKGITEDDLLFHDEQSAEPTLAYLLSRMRHPEFPEPIGVFRAVARPRFDDLVNQQVSAAVSDRGRGDLQKLFSSGDTWTVQEEEETLGSAESEPELEIERNLAKDTIRVLRPKRPLTVEPSTPVADVLQKLVDNSIGCVLIDDGEKISGIFSERDALLRLNTQFEQLGSRPVSEFMTTDPQMIESDATIAFALHKMDLGHYRHLPVCDDGKLIGIISIRDILNYITQRLKAAAPA